MVAVVQGENDFVPEILGAVVERLLQVVLLDQAERPGAGVRIGLAAGCKCLCHRPV